MQIYVSYVVSWHFTLYALIPNCLTAVCLFSIKNWAVAALHQAAPGQMTWLEGPPPWLRPVYCFGNSVNRFYDIWPLNALFIFFWQWNNLRGIGGLRVLRATTKKGQLFWGKKCIRVTRLEDVLTSKWPGSFAALAPPLNDWLIHYWGSTVNVSKNYFLLRVLY